MAYEGKEGSFRKSTGSANKTEAQTILANEINKLRAGIAGPANQDKLTVTDLFNAVFTDFQRQHKKTEKDVRHRWRLHLEPFFGNAPILSVNLALIRRYQDLRISEGAENGTINREVALIRRAFNIAYEEERIAPVPTFKMLPEAQPRQGFVTDEAYVRLSEACKAKSPYLHAFFETASQLATRKGELLKLKVKDVDFAADEVWFWDTKNKQPRGVPIMSQTVRELLQGMCAGKTSNQYVFTHADGKRVGDLRSEWESTCVSVGQGRWFCRRCGGSWDTKCTVCDASKRRDRGYDGLLIHDLRRTGVKNLRRTGVPEETAMKISGHKTASTFKRYNIQSGTDLRQAAQLMDSWRSNLICTVVVQDATSNAKEAEAELAVNGSI
jgi:integrase